MGSNTINPGMEFLQRHGARRVREFAPQPQLLSEMQALDSQQNEDVELDYEIAQGDWQPLDLPPCERVWEHQPQRFVDGKDVGRTIAWLQSRDGYPVPVRLAEIGAVTLRVMDGETGQRELRREWSKVERVVAFMTDLFPWDEVEEFAYALQDTGFRLLPVFVPGDDSAMLNLFDFEQMRHKAADRSKDEMIRLEREAIANDGGTPSLVDGGLEVHSAAFDGSDAVVGLVKTHSRNYLSAEGWRAYYQLKPCQRTPAFRVPGRDRRALDVVSWYVRLDGARGELPNYGVVRVEIPEPFFKDALEKDFRYVGRVSRLICDYRCRDEGYSRSAISIHPIQRAEESLGALFTQSDTLISRFYHLTGL